MRKPAVGVIKQMEYEESSARELHINWDTKLFYPAGIESSIKVPAKKGLGWFEFKREYYRWLLDISKSYDAILLRYAMYDPLQTHFIRACKIPVFTVHHTLEIPELLVNRTLINILRSSLEKIVAPMTLSKAAGIIGITSEMANYNLKRSKQKNTPTYVYPNGALYKSSDVVSRTVNTECPEILMIASNFSKWIGLDLAVDAVKKSRSDFKIHVAGGLSTNQTEELRRDSRFIVHGYLDATQINSLISTCTIGIGSLALFRNGMKEGNTLKVKEYLKAGLPVFAGYQDVFEEGFPYYRNGDIDMDRILDFCKEMEDVSPELVSQSSRQYIDKKVLLKKIHGELSNVIVAQK